MVFSITHPIIIGTIQALPSIFGASLDLPDCFQAQEAHLHALEVRAGCTVLPKTSDSLTGAIILTVSKGCQGQKPGWFPFNPPLRGRL